MGLTTCSLQRSRRQKLCCGLKNVPDAIVMAMTVTTVVAEMTRTATDRAQTYAAARRASSTARNAPAAVMDTRTENAAAFVAAAATKTTTIRRPVSAASATDPTYESRTTGTRSDRTTNRRRMQRVERSIGRSSPDPGSSRTRGSPTRRPEGGARRPAWSTRRGPAPRCRTPGAALVRRRARPPRAAAVSAGRRWRLVERARRGRDTGPRTRAPRRRTTTTRRKRRRRKRQQRRRGRVRPSPWRGRAGRRGPAIESSARSDVRWPGGHPSPRLADMLERWTDPTERGFPLIALTWQLRLVDTYVFDLDVGHYPLLPPSQNIVPSQNIFTFKFLKSICLTLINNISKNKLFQTEKITCYNS